MSVQRRAHVEWEGNLPGGRGTFTAGSGTMEDMAVTWASRVERLDGKTSPEELLASSHATCFAMALAHTLAGRGAIGEGLTVEAVATLDDERLRIPKVDLDVCGEVGSPRSSSGARPRRPRRLARSPTPSGPTSRCG